MSMLNQTLGGSPSSHLGNLRTMFAMFGPRGWLVAALGVVGTLLIIGVPTALVDTPVFGRMIAARSEDYVFWGITAVLGGLIAGSYVIRPADGSETRTAAGGFLSFLAVGCPVCNKLVVAALGTSGALSIFAPVQAYIGIAAVVLLGWTLLLRARSVAGDCPTN